MIEKWYKVLFSFWNNNLLQNVKKISIGFGSFLIVVITTCTMPTELFFASMYGAGISFGTMVIMSIFGKNSNHYEADINPVHTEKEPALKFVDIKDSKASTENIENRKAGI